MIEISPKYEVLHSDLKKHGIGSFLISRKFKVYVTSLGRNESWTETFKEAKASRNYFSADYSHDSFDAENALSIYFNNIQHYPGIEDFLAEVMTFFILNKENKTDFSDVKESVKLSGFKPDNFALIEKGIEAHDKKVFKEEKAPLPKTPPSSNNNEIFVVHGHNGEAKLNVSRTLEKLGLIPIVLHEQSNSGQTIIEKFEKHSNVGFAIVLLTYDDHGNAKNVEVQNKRARQNVIFELGFFMGKLGRNKVMPLYEEGVELPSDMSGIVYTPLDKHEAWKSKLVKELKTAGYKVDANKI